MHYAPHTTSCACPIISLSLSLYVPRAAASVTKPNNMDAVAVPALDLAGAAALATGAAAVAAAQAGVAAVQAATPRSTVQQLQDSGILGQRVRRLSNTARKASMSVISVQQQWLINNLEVMLSTDEFADGLDAAPTAAAPVLNTAKTLSEVPQALMEGRVLFSAKLSALLAAASGVLVWYGVSAAPPEQADDSTAGGGAANYYMLGAAVGALLLGTAGFLAGRKSAPAQDVRWQREENSDGQQDGSKKNRARLQRVA